MEKQRSFAVLIFLILAVGFLAARLATRPVEAQTSKDNPAYYDLQRSTQIDRYQVVAKSGVGRGQTLYYYKCWMCHNEHTIRSERGDSAPFMRLKGLFQRDKLTTNGKPVNDETITERIKDGGPGMPSFRTTMSDADIRDLISYLKSDQCCVDGENPPANPWYKAAGQN